MPRAALWLRWTFAGLSIVLFGEVPSFATDLDQFATANLLFGAAVLQTGNGTVLVRTNLSWSAPTNLTHPALVFAFGFASDELFEPDTFFDSFSITLRNADRSFVAPIVTADLLGATLAPANPDGTQFGESDVQPESLAFPPLGSTYRFEQAFLVLVVLPPALAGQTGTVAVSLFDNLNTNRSVGFVNYISVVPGPGSLMELESSASVAGPYAREDQVLVRHARRTLSLPTPAPHRFYRLQAASVSSISSMAAQGPNWEFHYTGANGGPPLLLSSAQVIGPYAIESGVSTDTATRTLRVRQEGAARFFRIRSEIPLTIRGLSTGTSQMSIRYEEPHP
jgi:hypothetical protein